MREAKLFIGGNWVDPAGGATVTSINPATGEAVAEVAAGDAKDVDAAVTAARAALDGPWGSMTPAERSGVLRRLAELIADNADAIAELDTLEMGRPLGDSLYDVEVLATELIHFFAGAPDKIRGETIPVGPEFLTYTRREPWGVVGAIVPWNYPFFMAVAKVAPILACGNTVVLKPAEQSSFSALELGRLCQEAGIPNGVVNVVTGYGETAGAALARHMDVDKVSFTGSTSVGRSIMEAAARSNLKSVTLELGGKSPNIVFTDANLEPALDAATMSVFFNQGQTCTAATRLLVHEQVADEFVASLVDKAQGITVGDPMKETTQMGAIASRDQFERIMRYIDTAAKEGATCVTGGARPDDSSLADGYFLQPTIFTDVQPDMTIAREEVFGPVLSVLTFHDDDEAVRLANMVEYGLAASVWTRDIARAHSIATRIHAGVVWINTIGAENPAVPYGGYKQSGFGREFGIEALHEYTRLKSIWVDLTNTMHKWA